MAAVVFGVSSLRSGLGNPWHFEGDPRDAVAAVASQVGADERVAVLGEPVAALYLLERGVQAFPVEAGTDLRRDLHAGYLVTGRYARQVPAMADAVAELADRVERIGSYPMQPGDMRLLDDMAPGRARRFRQQPDASFELELFRSR